MPLLSKDPWLPRSWRGLKHRYFVPRMILPWSIAELSSVQSLNWAVCNRWTEQCAEVSSPFQGQASAKKQLQLKRQLRTPRMQLNEQIQPCITPFRLLKLSLVTSGYKPPDQEMILAAPAILPAQFSNLRTFIEYSPQQLILATIEPMLVSEEQKHIGAQAAEDSGQWQLSFALESLPQISEASPLSACKHTTRKQQQASKATPHTDPHTTSVWLETHYLCVTRDSASWSNHN